MKSVSKSLRRAQVAASIATLFLAVIATASRLPAQTPADSASVKQAALDYIEGFYDGDSTRLVRSVRPEVFKYGFYVQRPGGAYVGEQMTWPEFHSYANSVKGRGNRAPVTAPKGIELLDVLDQTAAVKVTAFWGTDYLLLGKYDGRWMIAHVMWQSPMKK